MKLSSAALYALTFLCGNTRYGDAPTPMILSTIAINDKATIIKDINPALRAATRTMPFVHDDLRKNRVNFLLSQIGMVTLNGISVSATVDNIFHWGVAENIPAPI